MPTHWYYDQGHLKRTYGQIKGYVKPQDKLPGSIMSLSNTGWLVCVCVRARTRACIETYRKKNDGTPQERTDGDLERQTDKHKIKKTDDKHTKQIGRSNVIF